MTEKECLAWLDSNGLPTRQYSSPNDLFPDIPFQHAAAIRFSLPKDSGQKVALARTILSHLNLESSVLVWLRNWMVWPSSGHIPLVLRLRQAMGCEKPLEHEPGHLFGAGEKDDVVSLLILSFEFYWDCLIVDGSQQLMCFVSHDEFLVLMSTNQTFLSQLGGVLESAFSLSKLSLQHP